MLVLAIVKLDGLVGLIALALPIFALLTTIALALRRPRREPPAAAEAPKSTGRYGTDAKPASAQAEPQSGRQVGPKAAAAGNVASQVAEPVAPRIVGRAHRQTGQPAPRPAAPLDADAVMAAIAKAEAKGAQAELPALYIALAAHTQSGGSPAEAAELLRKSIRLAIATGQSEEHAKARLELGDIARMGGDLTTACEHWQIARRLYHELAHKPELSAAERRMRENGCPTDWVLNDF